MPVVECLKNYDGPLVLRDEVLDDEFKGAGGMHVIKKAVLMEPNLQIPQFINLDDMVIKEYNSSAIKSLETDKGLLQVRVCLLAGYLVTLPPPTHFFRRSKRQPRRLTRSMDLFSTH